MRNKKIYRRPKIINGQIKLQRGKVKGEIDMCVFHADDIPRCDRALIINYLCADGIKYNISLIKELERRGYDLDTLRFSIQKKEPK